jgi:hypothetical protein
VSEPEKPQNLKGARLSGRPAFLPQVLPALRGAAAFVAPGRPGQRCTLIRSATTEIRHVVRRGEQTVDPRVCGLDIADGEAGHLARAVAEGLDADVSRTHILDMFVHTTHDVACGAVDAF